MSNRIAKVIAVPTVTDTDIKKGDDNYCTSQCI